MMHQRLLLPAFHLITRGIPCINNNGCSQKSSFRPPLLSMKQKFISCGDYSRVGAYYSTIRRYSSTIQQQHDSSRHHTNGSITDRSQSFTHLDQVEDAITSVLQYYPQQLTTSQESTSSSLNNALQEKNNILHKLHPHQREALSVSTILSKRIRSLSNSNDCRRCWLQKKHCICNYCTSLEDEQDDDEKRRKSIPNVNRLFLLVSVAYVLLILFCGVQRFSWGVNMSFNSLLVASLFTTTYLLY